MTTRIAIHGAAGRMGQRLIALGAADPDLKIVAALERAGHPQAGRGRRHDRRRRRDRRAADAQTLDEPVDVVIDFSVPAGADAIVETCLRAQDAAGGGDDRLGTEQQQNSSRSGQDDSAPLVAQHEPGGEPGDEAVARSPARRSQDHPTGADVEIIERHHRFKEDAPSGTALKFGEIIAGAMGQTEHTHGREGRPGQRPHGEIGYHAVRTGDNPGEHTIIFGLLGETLEITRRRHQSRLLRPRRPGRRQVSVGKPASSIR